MSSTPTRPRRGSRQPSQFPAGGNSMASGEVHSPCATRNNVQGVLGDGEDNFEYEENQTTPRDKDDPSSLFSDRIEELRTATLHDFSQQRTENKILTTEIDNLRHKNKA